MNFAVYTKDGCPYCDKVKQVLELTGSKFVVYNLDQHFDRKSFYGEFGEGSTFPQVVVDGKKLGGCIDTIQFLKEKRVV
jgi:glutaredoxin